MPPVPITLLAGFLGAGKTTLLSRLLADPQGIRFGVLVNDFGAINIDAALVADTKADRISLANGCICCSIRDDLLDGLRRLLSADPSPDRIIIEASGVARPMAIVDALLKEAEGGAVRLDGTFCLADAAALPALDYADTELAIDQAAVADLVILNKRDLVDAAGLAAAEAALRDPLPASVFLPTQFAEVPREVLFGPRPHGDAHRHSHAHGGNHHHHAHDHHHNHGSEFAAWSWTTTLPLREADFRAAVQAWPPGLLRAKGVLALDGRRVAYQQVGKRRSLELLPGEPPRESALVAIGRRGSFDPASLDASLAPLTSRSA